MFEMMLMGGGSQGIMYPNSGPGPKYLKRGDTTLGLFGELTDGALLTHPELKNQLGFYAGQLVPTNDTGLWFKMFVDGKVIFFPRYACVQGVSWSDLYANGLVYGTDDTGTPNTATPTNQLRIVTAGDSLFKVRCFAGKNTPGVNDAVWANVATAESEWGRIVAALMQDTSGLPATGPRWNLYSSSDKVLLSGAAFVSRTMFGPGVPYNAVLNMSRSTLYSRQLTQQDHWYPVLELIDPDDKVIIPIKPVYSAVPSPLGQMVPTPYTYSAAFYPVYGTRAITVSDRRLQQGSYGYVANYPLPILRTEVKCQVNPLTAIGSTTITYN